MDSLNEMNLSVPSEVENHVISRIDDFHILCIPDTQYESYYLKDYAKDLLYGNKESIPLFSDALVAKTFVVSESSYNENEALFYAIRKRAREDIITRVASGVTAYFLSEYAELIRSSIPRNPKLKNIDLLDVSVRKINKLLKRDTFLAKEAAWDRFYQWYKSYITKRIIRETVEEKGMYTLIQAEKTALNELFQDRLVKQIKESPTLMASSIGPVEQYLYHWMEDLVPSLYDQHPADVHLELFLGLETKKVASPQSSIALPIMMTDQYLSVMSNVVYQSIREVLSNQCFQKDKISPSLTVHLQKRTLEGKVQIIPFGKEAEFGKNASIQSYKQTVSITELDVDIFDALCSLFISNASYHQDIVEVKIKDLLMIRGIQAKKAGHGRRGGYESEQVQRVLKALSIIQQIWVDFHRVAMYRKGKPIEMRLTGRTFIFVDENHKEQDMAKLSSSDRIFITVGDVFSKFLGGSSRQIALLPLQALQYNPRQEKWEKKMIRYLSWRWRTQARRADYDQPYKMSSILNAIGEPIKKRTPSRTRERLEQALDRLQDDGLILSWEYVDWDESIAEKYGWARLWNNTTIVIDPPEIIKEQYRTISKKGHVRPTSKKSVRKQTQLGLQLRSYRQKLGLTLVQTAEELDVSTAYISSIERGKRIPSEKVYYRIMNWVQ
ncbi:MAG TPA: helix-turn-helix transcriptional regulator [Virgibacillus sp.]|nr:helix-turn-helix transcriptional regulator [Virgibacillus sp.]